LVINKVLPLSRSKLYRFALSFQDLLSLKFLTLIFFTNFYLFIMNIFVAKLSSTTTSEDLRTLFEEYGEVTSANVITDRVTGYSKKFGFVEMKNDDEANKAIKELDNCQYDNAEIVVKQARPREESSRRENYSRSRY